MIIHGMIVYFIGLTISEFELSTFFDTKEEAKEALKNDGYAEGSKIFKVTVTECQD